MLDTQTTAAAAAPESTAAKSLAEAEAAALADAMAEFGGEEGGETTPASSSTAQASEEGDSDETEPTEKKPKPAEEKKPKPAEEKAETLGESWRKVRAEKKALNYRTADLDKREEKVKQLEASAGTTAKELEQYKAKVALLDRLIEGDPEALQGLNLNFDKLTEGYLRSQSGDAKTARLERELKQLQAKLAGADEQKTQAEQDHEQEQLFQQAVSRLTTAAKSERVLARFPVEKVVAMGEVIAGEYVRANKPVPPPEQIAREMARRIHEDYEEHRKAMEAESDAGAGAGAPKGAPTGPRTVSRRDSAERAPGPKKTYNPDDEAAELLATLRGSAA